MKSLSENSNFVTLFQACRPKFLVASAAPILVGSFLAYATTGSFHFGLFILALPAIMALQAGANMANDYFDHISGNDEVSLPVALAIERLRGKREKS